MEGVHGMRCMVKGTDWDRHSDKGTIALRCTGVKMGGQLGEIAGA